MLPEGMDQSPTQRGSSVLDPSNNSNISQPNIDIDAYLGEEPALPKGDDN